VIRMSSSTQSCLHKDVRIFDGLRYCLACGETTFDQVAEKADHSEDEPSKRYRYRRLNYGCAQEDKTSTTSARPRDRRAHLRHYPRQSARQTCLRSPILHLVNPRWRQLHVSNNSREKDSGINSDNEAL
jgi:hypothetical protein